MAKKSDMLRAIRSANKRIQRLEKAGFTRGDAYSRAKAEIAKSHGESPFHAKHTKLKQTGTVKELQAAYKAAQSILKQQETRVGVIRRHIKQNRNATMLREYGVTDTSKSFYDFLNSDAFKHMSEKIGSDQVLSAAAEARAGGSRWSTIENRINKYMASQPDAYYIEDAERAIKGGKKSLDQDSLPFDDEWLK